MANDPDADRLAIAQKLSDGTWKIFNGNEIGSLLGWWQLQVHVLGDTNHFKRENLYYIASAVSSKMLGTIAKKEGLSFIVSSFITLQIAFIHKKKKPRL